MSDETEAIYQRLKSGGRPPSTYVDPVDYGTASTAELVYARNLGRLSDSRNVSDLVSLVPQRVERPALAAIPTKAAIGQKTGLGVATTKTSSGSTTAGIASPLTEVSPVATPSEFVSVLSTDGLIAFAFPKTQNFTDANGNAVAVVYANS